MNVSNDSQGGIIRTALFVDFDNIHSSLEESDSHLARMFGKHPDRWVDWLTNGQPDTSGRPSTQKRRILIRRCYLNPAAFGRYRSCFVRSAFETIDCPTLTARGKTSADMHLALDMMDLLDQEPFIDEFLILSADADFTPALLRLRKHDRRTTILPVGPASQAYTSASDGIIGLAEFIGALQRFEVRPAPGMAPVRLTPKLPWKTLQALSQTIRDRVAAADKAVPLATLAHDLRERAPDLGPEWGGYGSFSSLLDQLDFDPLQRTDGVPGFLFDPRRHNAPARQIRRTASDSFPHDPELAGLIDHISRATQIPILTREQYVDLFVLISEEIQAHGYKWSVCSRAIRNLCQEQDLPLRRRDVDVVLRTISGAGHRFGERNDSASVLAGALLRGTIQSCASRSIFLTERERQKATRWLTGSTQATVTARSA